MQCVTCVYCCGIASGGGFERSLMSTDVVATALSAALLFPFPFHWCKNGEGWLSTRGFQDRAGSGTIHLVAGSSSLVLSMLCGGRRDGNGGGGGGGTSFIQRKALLRSGHSVIAAAAGGVAAVVGLVAVNVGSRGRGGDDDADVAMMNSVVAASAAGLASLAVSRCLVGQWSVYRIIWGMLAGAIRLRISLL